MSEEKEVKVKVTINSQGDFELNMADLVKAIDPNAAPDKYVVQFEKCDPRGIDTWDQPVWERVWYNIHTTTMRVFGYHDNGRG